MKLFRKFAWVLFAASVVFASCDTPIDEDDLKFGLDGEEEVVTFKKISTVDVGEDFADLSCTYAYEPESNDDLEVEEAGFCYREEGTKKYTTIKDKKFTATRIKASIEDLDDDTDYEFYAYVVIDGEEYTSETETFTTEKAAKTPAKPGGDDDGGDDDDTDLTGATSVTLTFKALGLPASVGTETLNDLTGPIELDGISLDWTDGSTPTRYYASPNFESIRFYAGANLTIAADEGNILKIEFTFTAGQGTDVYNGLGGSGFTAASPTTGTWTGNDDEVSLSVTGKQARIMSMKVTYK